MIKPFIIPHDNQSSESSHSGPVSHPASNQHISLTDNDIRELRHKLKTETALSWNYFFNSLLESRTLSEKSKIYLKGAGKTCLISVSKFFPGTIQMMMV